MSWPPGLLTRKCEIELARRDVAYTEAPSEMVSRARAIDQMCREYDVPLAAAALQFSLRDPRLDSTIVGMTRPERVRQTLDLAAFHIPQELWQRLEPYVGPPVDPEAVRWRRD